MVPLWVNRSRLKFLVREMPLHCLPAYPESEDFYLTDGLMNYFD